MPALEQVESLTARAMHEALAAAQDRGRRTYLGASVLGGPCARALWLEFRWVHEPERFDGRKLSIFETGHRWEARLVDMLKAAGIALQEVDPDTGGQWSVQFAGGHGGGHLDGIATEIPEAPVTPHVVEFKSHNDKSFKALQREGVQKSKPAHYAQMQVYMHERQLTRALYVAVNKNDDDLYVERVRYDPAFALSLIVKAERIVTVATPPPCTCPEYFLRAGYGCARHEEAALLRNCRTCLHSTPEMDGDGRWSCARHRRNLTADEQRAGCPNHLFIPALVDGEQIDADEIAETVTYRLANGETWTDGPQAAQAEALAVASRTNPFGVSADEVSFEGALS